MNIQDILDEPLYFKDSERDIPERSLTYNVREYIAQGDLKGLILFLPTQEHADILTGYALVQGMNNVRVRVDTTTPHIYRLV